MSNCGWADMNTANRVYHDTEWGVPVHDDRQMFEHLSLESLQCGLSWDLMLKKREVFRQCFDGFDYDRIAAYTEDDVLRILNTDGMLKSEHGVHRLVRISPFNANGKRQTSFSACEVMPDIEEDLDIEIDPKDIRIDTYRSSGAGGQHINKTSSAIRITHFPTGIVVTCQNERSQFQNKDKAFQELKIKLFMLKKQQNADKLDDIRGKVTEIAWGNQIRSYFLQPYQLIKDLRTNEEQTNAQKVLDGDIDPFINAFLKWEALGGRAREAAADATAIR